MSEIISQLGFWGQVVLWVTVILVPLVVIHEFGHFTFAKLFKVRINEFGVGIPPRTPLWTKWKGTMWSVNWLLPLGGFVRIYGDHDAIDKAEDEVKHDREKALGIYKSERLDELIYNKELELILFENGMEYDDNWKTFEKVYKQKNLNEGDQKVLDNHMKQLDLLMEWEMDAKLKSKEVLFNKNFIQKLLIYLGGIIFNFAAAWIMIFMLLNFASISRSSVDGAVPEHIANRMNLVSNTINPEVGVSEDSAAYRAGLRSGDELVSLNDKPLSEYSRELFVDTIVNNEELDVEYKNTDGQTKSVKVNPEVVEGSDVPKLGVATYNQIEYKSKGFWSSIAATSAEVKHWSDEVWAGLGKVFQALLPKADDRSALQDLSGPVAIGGIGSLVYGDQGFSGIMFFIALISITLAIMNLLPLPVLDGGRILILFIQKLTGRKNKKIERILINGTFALMILLFVWILVKDIGLVNNLRG